MAIDTNLLAFYPLNTNSDDDWSTNDGTDTAVSYGSGYATYNGTTSLTTMGNVLNFGTSDFSVAGWVYAVSVPGGSVTGRIAIKFTWAGANYTGWDVDLYDDGTDKIRFIIYSGGVLSGNALTTIPGLSTWFHFAAVRSGTNMILYINGSAVHTVATAAVNVTTSRDLMFGAVNNDAGAPVLQDFLDGSLDEMALWDRAITAVEAAAIHTAGRGNFASLLPADADLMGQFSSIVHSVAAQNADLSGQFTSIVHSVAAQNADLSGQFLTIVHSDVAAARADLEGQFTSIVHSVTAADADLSGQFLTIVHSDVAAAGGGGGPAIQGEGLQGNVLQGWGTQGNI